MKNRQIVDLVYELIAELSITHPALYFEVFTCSEPPGSLVDLYVVGMVSTGVPIGGFAVRAEALERRFSRTLLDMTTFFAQMWEEDHAQFYPSEVAEMYELHEEGEEVWWQLV